MEKWELAVEKFLEQYKNKDNVDILEFNFEKSIELNINDCNTNELKNCFFRMFKI